MPSYKQPSVRPQARDIGSSRRIRNYFERKEQIRLLVLCSLLMLVLALMNEARRPSTWSWMWAAEQAPSGQAANEPPMDTRISSTTRDLPIDGFTATRQQPPDALGTSPETTYLPGITPELLAPIRDNTVLRAAESEAWETMLGVLSQMTEAEIAAQPSLRVGFAQLFRQTDLYRGQLVTIQGSVRRVELIQPQRDSPGARQLFRWIVAPRGGANSPVVVYSQQKPDQFPMGDDLREEAEFTGFCFKRWAYAAQDGTRVAPLILAKTATWTPRPATPAIALPSAATAITILIALVGFSCLIPLAVYKMSVAQATATKRMRANSHDQMAPIRSDEVMPNVHEGLTMLAESDQDGGGQK